MIDHNLGRNTDTDTNLFHYNVYVGSETGYYMDDGDSNVYIGRGLVKVVELVIIYTKCFDWISNLELL